MRPKFRQWLVGTPYIAESRAYFAAMAVQPPGALKHAVDQCIRSLKAGGAWTTFDALYFFWLHDATAALINVKAPGTYALTPAGTPTFIRYRGYSGDPSNNFAGANLATAGGLYALNNAHMGVFLVSDLVANNINIFNTTAQIRARIVGDLFRTRANDAINVETAMSTALGHSMWSRDAAGSYTVAKDGIAIATPSVATTAVTSAALLIVGNPHLHGAVHFGSAMTASQRLATSVALRTMAASVGAIY